MLVRLGSCRLLEELQLNGLSFKTLYLGISRIWLIKGSQLIKLYSIFSLFFRRLLCSPLSSPLMVHIASNKTEAFILCNILTIKALDMTWDLHSENALHLVHREISPLLKQKYFMFWIKAYLFLCQVFITLLPLRRCSLNCSLT